MCNKSLLHHLEQSLKSHLAVAERGLVEPVLVALSGRSNMATTQRYTDLRTAMLKVAAEWF